MDPQLPIILIVIALLALTVAVTVFFGLRDMRRRNAAVQDMAAHAGGNADRGIGHHQGYDYRYAYSPGGRNQPPSFSLTMPCRAPRFFVVRRESGFDRFFKRLGLVTEGQTGDRDFDQQFFLLLDDPLFARRWFADSERRQAIRLLFGLGFTELRVDDAGCSAVWKGFRANRDAAPAVITDALGPLAQLRQALEDEPVSGRPGWRRLTFGNALVFAAVGIVAVAATALLVVFNVNYPPLDLWDMVLSSLTYSIPALLLFLFSAIVLLRGRASSHVEWLAATLIALFAFPAAGAGLYGTLNGALDNGAPQAYRADILNQYVGGDKNSRYHLVLRSWRGRAQGEDIEVRRRDYRRVVVGRDALLVRIRTGYLGYPWLEGYTVLPGGAESREMPRRR